MGVVAASNIKLDFINISPDDSQKINYPNACKLDKPYLKFIKIYMSFRSTRLLLLR